MRLKLRPLGSFFQKHVFSNIRQFTFHNSIHACFLVTLYSAITTVDRQSLIQLNNYFIECFLYIFRTKCLSFQMIYKKKRKADMLVIILNQNDMTEELFKMLYWTFVFIVEKQSIWYLLHRNNFPPWGKFQKVSLQTQKKFIILI